MLTKVQHAESGLFYRKEPDLGLLVYSPYTGLIYASEDKYSEQLIRWINRQSKKAPSKEYEKALGAGWFIDSNDAEFPIPHILPSNSEYWLNTVPYPKKPILVNWLITGSCPQECEYCYAEDLMRGKYKEPEAPDVGAISDSILNYDPLVVVLTGGDPLASKNLEIAIQKLHNKTGIIVDTGALLFQEWHLKLFKQYNVFVRISIDSERPNTNDALRPAKQKNVETVEAALKAICSCIEYGVKVSVQSVATKRNRSDFEAFGEKLFKLGVSGWRILMVSPSKLKYSEYIDLRGSATGQRRFYEHIFKALQTKQKNEWHNKMPVQVARNNIQNAIILIAPDGTFLTESNIQLSDICNGKVVIDKKFPKRPRTEFIFKSVNMHAHAERYLNLSKII